MGNNFFYTKSLPCSLWFFDKGKKEELRDKVLFIDARNYYTVVDRTLNEWSEWQLKNLNAIVWLYRGEVDKYQNLLSQYRQELGKQLSFPERAEQLETDLQNARAEAREAAAQAARKDKKRIEAEYPEIATAGAEADRGERGPLAHGEIRGGRLSGHSRPVQGGHPGGDRSRRASPSPPAPMWGWPRPRTTGWTSMSA